MVSGILASVILTENGYNTHTQNNDKKRLCSLVHGNLSALSHPNRHGNSYASKLVIDSDDAVAMPSAAALKAIVYSCFSCCSRSIDEL